MRVALIGTRGVPARYGGFETAVEEIGSRLVLLGHQVTVYCRQPPELGDPGPFYLGMRRVVRPCVRSKALETLSHTADSVRHLLADELPDAVIMFNSANSVYLPALRSRSIPVATHVDGLEWQRAKWGGAAKRYYRRAEALAVRWSDALIADAPGIQDYYRAEFGVSTELISYGAAVLRDVGDDRLAERGLRAGAYHLVVARFEPENHVDMIIAGYGLSECRLPLVVVGSAPHATEHTMRIEAMASHDPRVRLLGAVWDQGLLNQLYANCHTYLHGHSVGGTNPSLLRAMGAGAPVVANDVVFNREVLSPHARFFSSAAELAGVMTHAEGDGPALRAMGAAGQRIVAERYQWDTVARAYEELLARLAAGHTIHGMATGRRLRRDVRVSEPLLAAARIRP